MNTCGPFNNTVNVTSASNSHLLKQYAQANILEIVRFPHFHYNTPWYCYEAEQDLDLRRMMLAVEKRRAEIFLRERSFVHIGDWFVLPGELAEKIRKMRIELAARELQRLQALQKLETPSSPSLSEILTDRYKNWSTWTINTSCTTTTTTYGGPYHPTATGTFYPNPTTTTVPPQIYQPQVYGQPASWTVSTDDSWQAFFYHVGSDHVSPGTEPEDPNPVVCSMCQEKLPEALRDAAQFIPSP